MYVWHPTQSTPYCAPRGTCCSRADPELFNAGRLTEKDDFKRIWNSDSYRALRRSIKTHNLWDYCTDCYLD